MPRVMLAYTGGLYTLAAVHWLRHERNLRVITFSADLGQAQRLQAASEDALDVGAEGAHISDLRLPFITDYIFPALRAHARYESGYLLGTALSRPLLAKELVAVAREEGCEYIAHAAGNERNDAARLNRCIATLAPDLSVICPLDEWRIKTREQLLAYAERARLPIPAADTLRTGYDRNLWGATVRWFDSHDAWTDPPEEVFQMTASPQMAPDLPAFIEIEFAQGRPVGLNGVRLGPLELIARLNKLGGDNAVGRIDTFEEDLSGRKSRELYEAPAAEILYHAQRAIEDLVLGLDLIRCKRALGHEYAAIIYEGAWFSPLRECLDAFFARSQQEVTGKVRLRLFKGNCTVVGRQSAFSLAARPEPPEKPPR